MSAFVPTTDSPDAVPVARPWVELGLFAVATMAAAVLLVPGHFWGDDWTLYVRQAEGLLHGRVHRVVADVTFTARHSTMREFTPEGYPWGTPALLTIPIALFGRSIAAMKLTMALSFGCAVAAWYSVGRRWVGPLAGFCGATLMMVSLPLVSWTNLIASDIPYLAAVGLTALVVAHTTSSASTPLRGAVGVGAMAALTFAFRQEGLAVLMAAVFALAVRRWNMSEAGNGTIRDRVRSWRGAAARQASAAIAAFVIITVLVRLVLPSQLLPRYSGAGPGRIRSNLSFFGRSIGAQFGVYDPVDARVEGFDSPTLGWMLIGLLVVAATAGAWRLGRRRSPLDVLMLALAGSHMYGALTFPFPDTRYMFVPFTVACFVMAFGVDGVARSRAGQRLTNRLVPSRPAVVRSLVMAAVIGLLLVNQVSPFVTAARGAATARRIDRPAFSPFEPEPQEMFEAVRDRTGSADVIAFGAARAMTLFTDRRVVQVRGDDAIPPVAQWVVVELLPNGASPTPSGFVETWRNDRYTLLRAVAVTPVTVATP